MGASSQTFSHTMRASSQTFSHTMGASSQASPAHHGCQLTSILCTHGSKLSSIPCTPWVLPHESPVHTMGAISQASCTHTGASSAESIFRWLQGSSTTASVREKEGKHSRRWRLSSLGTLSRPVGKSCPHGNHTGQTDQRPAKFLRGSHGQRNHRVGLQNSG